MKKSLITLFVLTSVFALQAQSSRMTHWIRAGVNASTINISTINTNEKLGFQGGVLGEFDLRNGSALQTGILYTIKGTAYPDYKDEKDALNYLQVPLLFVYKIGTGNAPKLLLNGGGYGAYGLNIRSKGHVSSFEDNYLKSFDFGLVIGMGVEFGRFSVNLGYEHGLANISKTSESVNNRNSFVAFSYRLSRGI